MKRGFTLVEIMVVVIIMGVLAAVGVPKLFGVIAKARASEVPVAAGTYVSLQNAYLHENNGIGSWKNIGYGAPGTDGRTEYFEYSGCINGTILFEDMEPDMPGWQAMSRSKLNSCKTGGTWTVVIDPSGERTIEYRQIVSSEDCIALTSSWGVVGKTVEGMCATTGELHVASVESPGETPETPQSGPEETSSATVSSSPSSSASAESSASKQGDCDALAAAVKNDNGNKYGWVCVAACGMFAPPGKARSAGFDVDKSQKKKNTGGTCEKVEQDAPSGSTGSQAGEANSSAATGTQSIGGSSASTGSISGGSGNASGGTGGGSGEGSTSPASSAAESVDVNGGNSDEALSSSSEFPGFNGLGEPHAYDKDNDYCDGAVSENSCSGTYRPNNECKTWTEKKCKNLGNGQVANKANCGVCQEWKTSN